MGELTGAERARPEHPRYFKTEQSGYAMVQVTRPQTLAHGPHDSPVGQMAWIVQRPGSGPTRQPNCPRTR